MNEAAPIDEFFTRTLNHLFSMPAQKPDVIARMRRYLGQWAHWTKNGLSTNNEYEACVSTHLPGIASCWMPGVKR